MPNLKINNQIYTGVQKVQIPLADDSGNAEFVQPVIQPLTVTENGTTNAPEGVDGFAPVTINVPIPAPNIQALNVTQNGTYTPSGDSDGYAPVNVNVPTPAPVIQSLEVTENGTYSAPDGVDGYSPVTVNVEASGGFELPEPKLLCTLTAEMNLKEILTANPIPRKYKRSLVFFLHSGENIASQGGVYRNIVFYCTPVNGNAGSNFMAHHYNVSAVTPDSMNLGCTGGSNGAYFSISDDGSLTASGMTNTTRYFAVGNTIHYIEIPFNYETLTMDTTEWGAS